MYLTFYSTNNLTNFVCSAILRVDFMYLFIFREPAIMHMNDKGLVNLYGSVIFHMCTGLQKSTM